MILGVEPFKLIVLAIASIVLFLIHELASNVSLAFLVIVKVRSGIVTSRFLRFKCFKPLAP